MRTITQLGSASEVINGVARRDHQPRLAPWRRAVPSLALAVLLLGGMVFGGDDPNTITFSNESEEDATVRLVGPTRGHYRVPNGTQRTVHVAAGQYYIVTRYCDSSRRCTYSRGDSFDVIQTEGAYSEIVITLHKVPDGNYHTRPSTAAEFIGN